MKWPAERIARGSEKSFGMFEQAAALEAQGHDLIHLEVGRPFPDTPAFIKNATKAALDRGIVHYGDFRGTAHFRETLAEKVRAFNKIDVTGEEILVTNGLTHGAFALERGEEVATGGGLGGCGESQEGGEEQVTGGHRGPARKR